MKKDIEMPEVTNISVAIVKENEESEMQWNVYLVNQKNAPIEKILVSSNGYGEYFGEKKKTSTLRHFFEIIPAMSYVLIEPIAEDVFGLNNEYWVSFYIDQVLYDKKFIFLPDSIQEKNFTMVPVLFKQGVLIG